MKNKIIKNIPNIFFLVTLIVIFSLCFVKFILNRNVYNYVDNRMSYRFYIPNLYDFFSGRFQGELDNTIADQIPKYDFFKLNYNQMSIKLNYNILKVLGLSNPSKYTKIKDINIYKNYLLYSPYDTVTFENNASDDIIKINELKAKTKANIYMYFVDSDSLHKYSTDYNVDYKNYFSSNLKIDDIAYLDVSNFDDYKNYFYKTDHHWNNVGSYKGYTDIADMLGIKNTLKIQDEKCSDLVFYGSKLKNLAGIVLTEDRACIYKFNYPNFTIYDGNNEIDGYGLAYNKLEEETQLTYAIMYGVDIGELKIVNNDSQNKKKLLIISNSYSNAVNKLLASHYYKTYIIDGRHYDGSSMVDYINNKNIDDVVIIGSTMLFGDDIKW